MASQRPQCSLETGGVWTVDRCPDGQDGCQELSLWREPLSSGYPAQKLEDACRLLAWKWDWNPCQDNEQKLEWEEEKIS